MSAWVRHRPVTGEFQTFLLDQGYLMPVDLGDGRYAAVRPLLFTHAIITGEIGDRFSIGDNWCYHSASAAIEALGAWDGTGEPEGWHRHMPSGRRRALDDEGNLLHEVARP